MNQQNSTHAKSLARHIREHAESITRTMQMIEDVELDNWRLPDAIIKIEGTTRYRIQEMESVLKDMIPNFVSEQAVNTFPDRKE